MGFYKYFILINTLILLFYSCQKPKEEQTNLPLHNKKVLILGNSITENGKYVDFLEYYLRKNYPNQTLNIISIGLSGETVSGDSEANRLFPRPWAHSRLNDALTLIKPDLVLACYGMNDGIYSKKDSTRFSNYKKGILKLKEYVEATGAEIIMLTPTPFDPDPVKERISFDDEPQSYQNPYFNYGQVLYDYATWLTTLKDTKVINLNSHLNTKLVAIKQQKPDSTFIPDGVHPNAIGHFYMAEKILLELYPSITIGDVTSELNRLKIDPLFVMASNRRKLRSKGWLEYVGYTRGDTIKSNSIKPTIEKIKQLDQSIKQQTQNYTKE